MRLIVVDGLDAVGKDTHAERIRRYYEERGERVLLRSHPASDNYFFFTSS
jgi:thymidylate kinase